LNKPIIIDKKYNLPNLSIDDQLNSHAQDWAEHLGSIGTMQLRPNNKYGENIYMKLGSSKNLGAYVVNKWCEKILEIRQKNHGNHISRHSRIHQLLTKLLGNRFSKLGVGVSQDARGVYYVVANYDVADNLMTPISEINFTENNTSRY